MTPAGPYPGMTSRPFLLAAGLTVFSNLVFISSHGIVRHVGTDLHPFQIAFFSNLFSAVFFIPVLLKSNFRILKTDKFKTHLFRACFNAAALTSWYAALALTMLADATALGLTGPLFVTIGAVLFLGEAIRGRRLTALVVGAIGALVIIRPGFEQISVGFILVLLSAAFAAGTKIIAKHLRNTDSAITCSAYVAILQTPITFVFAIFVWKTPTMAQLAWMFGVGMCAAIAQLSMVQAYSYADVSALEPFVFTRLIWAASIGWLAFGEVPAFWTWVGAAIIVASSTYIAHREAQVQRTLPSDRTSTGL
jgi:drug/metabolite transporter (DMT)-like permease